jgi:hypothetical protein
MQIAPTNRVGKSRELSSEILMQSAPDASRFFITVGNRLLHPGGWHKLTRKLGAVFYSTDANGLGVKNVLQEDYYIRIRIPGPGNLFGMGYDWVRVESLSKTKAPASGCELLEMKIRPCRDPRKKNAADHSEMTSSFLIERIGRIVKASYYRWNDHTTSHMGTQGYDKRETIAFGTTLGLSEGQWTSLLQGMLSVESF